MSHTHLPNAGAVRSDLRNGTGTTGAHDPFGVRDAVSRLNRLPLRAEPTWNDSSLGAPNGANADSGAGLVRGRVPSGGRGADVGALREARGRGDLEGPNFNLAVPPNGYAWWYVDGISQCGTRAISVIAFIGSVFSPWYRWSGRKDPENHVCINVATYGPGGRFTMTDRGRAALRQTTDSFTVGPSSLTWVDGALVIDVNEVSSPPIVGRVKGQIRVTPSAVTSVELPLTPDGAHIWRPFGPVSGIDVNLDAPGWQWSGHGYFDANFGTRALEEDFAYWTWGRYPARGGSTCFYDATRLDGSELASGFHFTEDGSASDIELPPQHSFRRSNWLVKRETRGDATAKPRQVKSMLDAPFYSRAMVETELNGEKTVGVFEALDLVRFRQPLLKPMLAVRVPRRSGWRFDENGS